MRAWVQRRSRQKGCATASEYVLQLLRHDQLQEARDRVDARLLQALDSGEPQPISDGDWQTIRATGRKRAASPRRAKR
jgi:hypothetical protein